MVFIVIFTQRIPGEMATHPWLHDCYEVSTELTSRSACDCQRSEIGQVIHGSHIHWMSSTPGEMVCTHLKWIFPKRDPATGAVNPELCFTSLTRAGRHETKSHPACSERIQVTCENVEHSSVEAALHKWPVQSNTTDLCCIPSALSAYWELRPEP